MAKLHQPSTAGIGDRGRFMKELGGSLSNEQEAALQEALDKRGAAA